MKNSFKLLLLIGAPLIALISSCATNTTTPVAHRHGNLVHSHALTEGVGTDHQHDSQKSTTEKTIVKIAKKKTVVSVKPAKPSDIKPMGIKAIGHKHHTHVEPTTGEESVPC